MEGSKRIARRVLSVERESERSRLESQHLASAYERVLPEIRIAFAERHSECEMLPTVLDAEEAMAFSYSTSLVAMGGHLWLLAINLQHRC